MKSMFGEHINLTAKVLDMRLQRQNIVTGNITNINTPGYKPQRLEFEQQLQSALALDQRGKVTRTDPGHMPSQFSAEGFSGEHIKEFEPRHVFGEDSVDIDKEMALMAKNSMMYNALTEVIKKNFSGLQKAIQEGAK